MFIEFVQRLLEPKEPPKSKSKVGENVTDWEAWIMTSISSNVLCPDCQEGLLQEGPSGGSAVNAFCLHCPAMFVFVEKLPRRKVWAMRVENRVMETKAA